MHTMLAQEWLDRVQPGEGPATGATEEATAPERRRVRQERFDRPSLPPIRRIRWLVRKV
jgi:hypothetical protein